jgi:hypothetical protein
MLAHAQESMSPSNFVALLRYIPLFKQGVCHTVILPFTLKSISRQKKNYGNSKISPSKNIIFKKSSKETKILQDHIITL